MGQKLKESIRNLLSGIVDYAGLYPPAKLPLDEAFKKYTAHRNSSHSWMLSKFVVGQDLLPELIKLINAEEKSGDPYLLTIVANPSSDLAEFKQVVTEVVKSIALLYKVSERPVRIPSLEIKLPSETLFGSDTRPLIEAVDYTVKVMAKSSSLPHQVFFEIPGFDFEPKLAHKVLRVLNIHNNKVQSDEYDHYAFSGFKIRCGGVEDFQFPPTRYLADTIVTSRDENVPIKFTAGLHHPIRHHNNSVKTKMHGFLNVFGSAILSYTQDLSVKEAQQILDDEDPSNFIFMDSYFAWKELAAPLLEVKMLRMLSVTSYGSCSFEEPVEDLQELKLLN